MPRRKSNQNFTWNHTCWIPYVPDANLRHSNGDGFFIKTFHLYISIVEIYGAHDTDGYMTK